MLHSVYPGYMPYKGSEQEKEAKRLWYQANIERERERSRRYKEAHREQHRATNRRRYWAKRDQLREQGRAWREANPEKVRENYRRWRDAGGKNPLQRRRNQAVAELWHEQGGCCYLCEKPVPLEDVHLEHDHRCCPRLSFCAFCIRGVSCAQCNHVVGFAEDDPDRLELIARNLRAKLAEVDVRIAAVPVQLSLEDVL